MKKTRFSDNQIVDILKQAEQGVPVILHNVTSHFLKSKFYNPVN